MRDAQKFVRVQRELMGEDLSEFMGWHLTVEEIMNEDFPSSASATFWTIQLLAGAGVIQRD